jgi:hypothetical protein
MELISGLITIVLLVLVPGLAYGQSPKSILKSCSESVRDAVRAGAEGGAWSTVTGCASYHRGDFVLRLDESRISQWQRQMDEIRLASRGRPRLRADKASAGTAGRMWRGTGPNIAYAFAHARGVVTAGAGLHPDVLRSVRPWLRGGYLDGSGHGDPADNKHGTLARIVLSPPVLPHTPFRQTHIKPSYSRQTGPRAREGLEASPASVILWEHNPNEFARSFITASRSCFRTNLPGHHPADLVAPPVLLPTFKSVEERCI